MGQVRNAHIQDREEGWTNLTLLLLCFYDYLSLEILVNISNSALSLFFLYKFSLLEYKIVYHPSVLALATPWVRSFATRKDDYALAL